MKEPLVLGFEKQNLPFYFPKEYFLRGIQANYFLVLLERVSLFESGALLDDDQVQYKTAGLTMPSFFTTSKLYL